MAEYVAVRLTEAEGRLLAELIEAMGARFGPVSRSRAMRVGLVLAHRVWTEPGLAEPWMVPPALRPGPEPAEKPARPKRPRGRPRKGGGG